MGIFNNIFKKEKQGKQDKIVKVKKPSEKVAKKPEAQKASLPSSYRPEKARQSKKDDSKKPSAVAVKKEKKEIKKVTTDAYKILIRPLVTEKATYLGTYNKYVFEVSPKFSKIEVKKAIQSVYGVTPISVNVISVSGKGRRHGKVLGRTKNWKKAIITLKPGEKIEVYEGV